jgi:hypothetical protein
MQDEMVPPFPHPRPSPASRRGELSDRLRMAGDKKWFGGMLMD